MRSYKLPEHTLRLLALLAARRGERLSVALDHAIQVAYNEAFPIRSLAPE